MTLPGRIDGPTTWSIGFDGCHDFTSSDISPCDDCAANEPNNPADLAAVKSHNGPEGEDMGDKGGKKDKEKSKQQQVNKQKQDAQRKQEKSRPRT